MVEDSSPIPCLLKEIPWETRYEGSFTVRVTEWAIFHVTFEEFSPGYHKSIIVRARISGLTVCSTAVLQHKVIRQKILTLSARRASYMLMRPTRTGPVAAFIHPLPTSTGCRIEDI